MPFPEPPTEPSPLDPPISLNLRLLDRTLRDLEWIGEPNQETCLACGASYASWHAESCPVAAALAIGTGHDALDAVIRDTVFLTAAERYSVFVPLGEFVRKLEGTEAMVTRILGLFAQG